MLCYQKLCRKRLIRSLSLSLSFCSSLALFSTRYKRTRPIYNVVQIPNYVPMTNMLLRLRITIPVAPFNINSVAANINMRYQNMIIYTKILSPSELNNTV